MKRSVLILSTVVALTSTIAACSSGGDGADGVTVGIGYFQSPTLNGETLISARSDLSDNIGGTLKLTPIESGVAGLAALKGGAFSFISGIGNPPMVGAIASNTDVKVVLAQSYDAAALVVGDDITSDDDLRGKAIGALQGSSEDFEIRGWLKAKGLDDTKVVGFPSEAAIGAAFKAGRIDGAYAWVTVVNDLKQDPTVRQVVTAEEIAELGYSSFNVLAVTDKFSSDHPEVVQQVVCQYLNAQALLTGDDREKVITDAAGSVGAESATAVAGTTSIPFISADKQLSIFTAGTGGDVAGGDLAKSYVQTADFLKEQGRIDSVPSSNQIVERIDATYVQKAIDDGCGA